MKHIGHIKLYRAIQDNSLYLSEPFTKTMAWIDLLLNAEYKTEEVLHRGQMIVVERGQFVTTIGSLAERWKWTRSKVQRYLEYLVREGAIQIPIQSAIQKPIHLNTLISIVNYDKYQSSDTNTDTKCDTHIIEEVKNINNNINNLSIRAYENDSVKTSHRSIPPPPSDVVDRIYSLYPSKCPVKGRPTGKSKSDKAKIARLLKELSEEELTRRIVKYLEGCVESGTPIKNLSTLLNNLPDETPTTVGEWRPTSRPTQSQQSKPSKLDQYKQVAIQLGIYHEPEQSDTVDEQ